MRKTWIGLCLAAALLLSGCGSQEPVSTETAATETGQPTQEIDQASGEIFAMDTYMTITCYGERCQEALSASLAEIQRLDALLSVGDGDSEISRLNATGTGTLSDESAAMVEMALELYEKTDAAFDVTVYPLMELWGFTTGQFAVPDADTLAQLLDSTGSDQLSYDSDTNRLTLGQGQGIDLGGIAKGYTSAKLMEIFREYDLVSGVISLGGNVQLYGAKPDGSLWRVGIQDPFAADEGSTVMGVLTAQNQAVITSGAYERYFVDETTGQTYHHILDPKTGYPARSGLVSVTIVSADGMLADGLSTACYVMGLDRAISYWQTYGDDFDMILMTEDGQVYITAPLQGQFTTDYPLHIIHKEGGE
jgi:thiamine biosynthesis lipoprotein